MQRRGFLLGALAGVGGAAARAAELPPLPPMAQLPQLAERPAQQTALANQRLITGIARAGTRLVAVGQRGHTLLSDDGGRSWTQAAMPVSADLTAVAFVDARVGYATGHDGLVLGTRDAGSGWTLLLDGLQANALNLAQMERRVGAGDANEQDRKLLEEARRNVEAGADKPFLDLHFSDPRRGFVVGAYGLLMQTDDGGHSWRSWFDRVDNPGLLNLYAICESRGAVFIAGEAGLLLRLDRDAQRFRALVSPYKGSFFGLLPTEAGVLAYGMRGNAFLSADGGDSWQPVSTGLPASIVGGAVSADGSLVLVDQGGNIAISRDAGRSFQPAGIPPGMPLATVAFGGPGQLVLGGPRGIRSVELTIKDK